jgi:AcrR family transcriptional regulator
MVQRKDGRDTRDRVLRAAREVFAEKGLRDATVAEICARAGANLAAVNYHFRDKDSLYVEAWRHAFAEAHELYPADGGVPAHSPLARRLRGHITSLLRRMTDEGRLGHFHRLHMMELANPSGLVEPIMREAIAPLRQNLLSILRDLLGAHAAEDDLILCEMSVVGQCRAVTDLKRHPPGIAEVKRLSARSIEDLADHITDFSLAGVQAVRQRVDANARRRQSRRRRTASLQHGAPRKR